MKHLKIYENFDQYEFGEFTDDLLDRYSQMQKLASGKVFSDEQKAQVKEIIPNYTRFMGWIDFTRADNTNRIRQNYRVYNMGDFCYGIIKFTNHFNKDNVSIEKIWVIDDFDNLLVTLQRIVDELPLESLYESISRYDFGKYTNPEEITDIFNSFEAIGDKFDDLGVFTHSDLEQIDNSFDKFDGFHYHLNKPKNTITFNTNGMHYLAYALGDYCYGFFVEDTSNGNVWTYCEIMDDIDRLCEVMEENIRNAFGLVNESITRHDFGVYTDSSEILDFLLNSMSYRIAFTTSEEEQLGQLVGNRFDINFDGIYCIMKNEEYRRGQICLYSFGDYCYAITIGDYSLELDEDFVYEKMYIIDDFNEFLNIIKTNFNL